MDLIRESSLIQYFKQEGREEGIEEGIEQGQRKSTLEDILEVLKIRFDLDEAHPLSDRIAAIEDLHASSSCTVRRYRCPISMNLDAC